MEDLSAKDFLSPTILLYGVVDYHMHQNFRQQLAQKPSSGVAILELSTLGGEPEVAPMIGEDIRYQSEMNSEERFVFLGKAAIYSAGTTLMSFLHAKTAILHAVRAS